MADDTTPALPGMAGGATEPIAIAAGTRFGHVVIQRKLTQQGAMGEVYLGFHEGFETPVVVKLLPARSEGSDLAQRFLREAQVAVRLDHPHIVRVHDVGREHAREYLVMEYVEGEDLERYASDRGGRLPTSEALRLIGQAARGLAYAHGQGVVHRDIKPANLIRRAKDGAVKIVDFGLARAAGLDNLTSVGQVMGTLPYMAYEHLRGLPVAASDVYSLGITLYRLLAGRLPVVGSLDDLLRYHSEGNPPTVSSLRPVSAEVEALVRGMLAGSVSDRLTAITVAREVDRCLEGMGERSSAVSGQQAGVATEVGADATGDAARAAMAADLLERGSRIPSSPGQGPAAEPTLVLATPRGGQRGGARRRAWKFAAIGVFAIGVTVLAWRFIPRSDPGSTEAPLTIGAAVVWTPTTSPRGASSLSAAMIDASLSPSFESRVVRQHEGVRFVFRCEAPVYAYVFNEDPKGTVACLFPDVFAVAFERGRSLEGLAGPPPGNPIPPRDGEVMVPPPVLTRAGPGVKWFEFDDTKGREWFLLALSPSAVPELEEARRRVAGSGMKGDELRSLAARLEAEAWSGEEARSAPLRLFDRVGEKALGPGWSFRSGRRVVAWTLYLDHQ